MLANLVQKPFNLVQAFESKVLMLIPKKPSMSLAGLLEGERISRRIPQSKRR
jgi:hypothetical protein